MIPFPDIGITPYHQDEQLMLFHGDCREVLESIPDESVHCVVTSPPYWGLRDYGIEPSVWDGDGDCEHEWGAGAISTVGRNDGGRDIGGRGGNYAEEGPHKTEVVAGRFCQRCNAWRGSLGLEPTPELYVEHLVEIFAELRPVLRKDGTIWLNLGDSYASSGGDYKNGSQGITSQVGHTSPESCPESGRSTKQKNQHMSGLKPKDLIGIPWRVAFALQADGWYLRSDIIWHKPNPMPESVHGSYWTRHRITIEEYENLPSMQRTKGGSQDRASDLSRLQTDEISDCQESLPGQPKGEGGDNSERTTPRCEGKEKARICVPTGASEQSQVCFDTEGPCDRKETGDQPQSEGVTSRGDIDGTGMASNLSSTPLQVPLLPQEEDPIDNRPRNPAEQGGTELSRECSPGVRELQHEKKGQDNTSLVDCPGCPKCEKEDGYIHVNGSGRPTSAHEYLFLFTKSSDYYYDADAVKESVTGNTHSKGSKLHSPIEDAGIGHVGWSSYTPDLVTSRNKRTVWTIATQSFKEAHFATYPQKLVEPCVLAGTSAWGVCPKCGSPWERIVEKERSFESGSGKAGNMPTGKNGANMQGGGETLDIRRGPVVHTTTTGWRKTCRHIADPVPSTVLDPFSGSGTTLLVANNLGRRSLGIEANADYCKMSVKRFGQGTMTL